MALIHADCLDLDSQDSSSLLVEDGHLGRLEVWNRPEQCELVAVCRAPPHFHLTSKAHSAGDLPSPARGSQGNSNGRLDITKERVRRLSQGKDKTRPTRWTSLDERHLGANTSLPRTWLRRANRLKSPSVHTRTCEPRVVVFERDSDDDRLRIDEAPVVDRQLQRAVAQLRSALGLDRKPPAIVHPVHQRVDAPVEHRLENVQTALRAHCKLHPDLPLGELSDQRVLVAMPGAQPPRANRSRLARGPRG